MENRCKRCNRELSDPNADYGWRCAQILGVSNQLSKMRPEAFERFLSGISKADKLMGNADFNSEQKNGMYKSYAKMALWDGIDKNKVAEAKKDSFAAAGGRKSHTNLAEELSEWGKGKITDKITKLGKDIDFKSDSPKQILMGIAKNVLAEMVRPKNMRDKILYEISKLEQQTIWRLGARYYLGKYRKFHTSAWMLEHSLQENPSDVWRGNDSRIAKLINQDNAYLGELDKALKKSVDGKIDTTLDSVQFKNDDLYYSIHKATVKVKGYKQANGKWIVHSVLKDTYDFTEIQSFMEGEKLSKGISKGTVANDFAVISQFLEAIHPYKITVDFYTER